MKFNMLYTDDASERHLLKEWKRDALEKFNKKLSDKDKPFPCIPATIGFSKNQLRYGFAEDPREESTTEQVAALLKEYTLHSRTFGNYSSLIIFYKTPDKIRSSYTVKQFEQLFWQQLASLSEIDEVEWPNNIPKDPHDPVWEFCFHGEPYFMYCATPAHVNRQSRHFDYMMLAITPRWVLKEFMKKESLALKIKSQVRKRLKKYDSSPIHPDLNSYGAEDNFEWKQYFIRDDETTISKCPFHRFLGMTKKST
ncbi:YqcI/YcgG family protein [Bacillus sp. ISL-47]|uniref:YqcI/YcgG family protein n=1 Tax=Bacillus sp. ISL-47 TaxID=2819130 RepID=UPI002035FA5E|nr:YqcI/YcgG family protein [Bacillus sp. ISL-47]